MAAEDRNILFRRNVKSGMFGLAVVPKENFFAYSTQFVFLILRSVSENSSPLICKESRQVEVDFRIKLNHAYFNIPTNFIADTT